MPPSDAGRTSVAREARYGYSPNLSDDDIALVDHEVFETLAARLEFDSGMTREAAEVEARLMMDIEAAESFAARSQLERPKA